MKQLKIILLFTIIFWNHSFAQKMELQNGDFLLVSAPEKDGLGKAIVEATQRKKALNFSHIAMVEKKEDSIFVLNATPGLGSCRELLSDFIQRENTPDKRKIAIYRLKKKWQTSIPFAIERANQMLGKPYNFTYVLSDSAYYCSDFVQKAFATDSIFQLNPMSFKNQKTGEFIPAWVKFYQNLKIPIPEGKLGCNPNEMASSEKLNFIKFLY